MNEQKPLIKFDDFSKVDMRIGYVESAEEIEGSDKLIKMQVDFGDMGKRQILAGITLLQIWSEKNFRLWLILNPGKLWEMSLKE